MSGGRAALAGILALAPLAFGAVQPWAWGILAVGAAILLMLWTLRSAVQPMLRVVWSPLYATTGAFFSFALIQLFGHLTLEPSGTRESLLKLATDLIFFFLAIQFWKTASGLTWQRLGLAAAVLAFSLAIFAILQFFSNPNLIYWSVRPRWGGWIFGPYVNHNHYAGLMEMLIPVGAGFFLSLPEQAPGRALAGFGVLVPVSSVLLSGSRGALIALMVEGVILLSVLVRFGGAVGQRFLAGFVGLGIAAATLIFFWMDPGAIGKHLGTALELRSAQQAEVGFRTRATVSRDALRMFWAHPLVGTGLGSFEAAYPRYQSFPSDSDWDHAHDDYAEALAETGLPGGILILGSIVLFVRIAFRKLRDRLMYAQGWIQLGAAIGCCGVLVHSLFDFNLHIPANAAWFAVCAAWANCGFPSPEKTPNSRTAAVREATLSVGF